MWHFIQVGKEGLREKMLFEEEHEDVFNSYLVDVERQQMLATGKGRPIAPDIGVCLIQLRNIKEASVALAVVSTGESCGRGIQNHAGLIVP